MGRVSKSITLPEETWALMDERVKSSSFSSKGRLIEHLIHNDSSAKIIELEEQLAEQKREKAELLEILKRLSGASTATLVPQVQAQAPSPPKQEAPKPLDEVGSAISDMLL